MDKKTRCKTLYFECPDGSILKTTFYPEKIIVDMIKPGPKGEIQRGPSMTLSLKDPVNQ